MASSSSFDRSLQFHTTQPPDPTWQPGQGCNDGRQEGEKEKATAARIPFTLIQPGKTKVDARALYKIMLGGIAPRPVALVGTYSADQTPNLAPVSWYQTISHDPPLVMISFGGIRERIKDSERNILQNKQFTISCSTEDYAEAVNFASINAPSGISEFVLTGLTPTPSLTIHAPRVEEAPFAMELELDHTHQWNNDQGDHTTTMIVGRVKMFHIRQDILNESGDGGIAIEKYRPITRFSGTVYGRSTVGYNLTIPKWDSIKDQEDVQEAIKNGLKKPHPDANSDPIAEHFP